MLPSGRKAVCKWAKMKTMTSVKIPLYKACIWLTVFNSQQSQAVLQLWEFSRPAPIFLGFIFVLLFLLVSLFQALSVRGDDRNDLDPRPRSSQACFFDHPRWPRAWNSTIFFGGLNCTLPLWCCVIKTPKWSFFSIWRFVYTIGLRCYLPFDFADIYKWKAYSFSVYVRKTSNLDLQQLEPQHRKSGATQELNQVKIQLNPAIWNSWGERKIH